MKAALALGIGIGISITAGCASTQPALQVALKPLDLGPAPAPLHENLFRRDHAGSISEEDLRTVLAAPVFLENRARLGVVPVANGYQPDADPPLAMVPGVLSRALEDSGLFEVTTEVSTDALSRDHLNVTGPPAAVNVPPV